MKWAETIVYGICALSLIAIGAIGHSNYETKKTLQENQRNTERFLDLQTKHAKEKYDLEKQITNDSTLATIKIKKLAQENSQLKMRLDSPVDSAALVFARLCSEDSECSLLNNSIDSPAEGSIISTLSLAYVIRKMDEAVERNNLAIIQQNQEIKICHGR